MGQLTIYGLFLTDVLIRMNTSHQYAELLTTNLRTSRSTPWSNGCVLDHRLPLPIFESWRGHI